MTNVSVMSVVHTRRAWLDRECLRIAAGTKGATANNLAWSVYLMQRNAGASEEAAQLDVARVIAWMEGRLDQIKAMRAAPPPSNGGAPCKQNG